MREYIERKMAEKAIMRLAVLASDKYGPTFAKAINAVHFVPAADVQKVKHGQWEKGSSYFLCSCCHYENEYISSYCPRCGAKMDGKDGEQK